MTDDLPFTAPQHDLHEAGYREPAAAPPVAEEAREAAFAAWYQAHVQEAGCEAVTHDAWQAGWAAALQWAPEHCAQAILAHMGAHGPQEPGSAWRRHLSIAARVAAGAVMTREDMLASAAEAVQRGDFVVCPSLQEGGGT